MTSVLGSKTTTAHDDTREFIRGLEMTARKVLTNANKKRMQELQRQQNLARRLGTNADVDPPKKFVIEVPPETEEWGDQLASKTMEIAPSGMVVGVRATRRPSRHRRLDGSEAAGSSFPALSEGGAIAAEGSDAGGRAGMAGRRLPQISRRAGGLTLSAPGAGQARSGTGDGGEGSAANGAKGMTRTIVPVAKIDGRLTVSPLFSASMAELTKPPRRASNQDDDPLAGAGGGGEDEEEAGGIANMRVVNASKVIGKGRSAGKSPHATRKPKRVKGAAETEGQGVTSWSSDDLRVKYRAEREREEAYQAFRLEEQVSEALEKDYGQVVAVPEVDRHPLYVAYYNQLERENTRCLLRASARNKMKRFITDVHTVWLTNLAHHPEFRRMVRGAAVSQEEGGIGAVDGGDVLSGGGDGSGGGVGGGHSYGNEIDQLEATTPGANPSRRGLDGGRDSVAIAASQSQIQSVQPKRAFREAFFYSGAAQDSSSWPGQLTSETASSSNQLEGQESAGTRGGATQLAAHNSLTDDGVEGGDSPELPPAPHASPALAVLASERRRLATVSTGGAGSTSRRSVGGGGGGASRRRSATGGGGDAGSWLDMSTRVLRVLRFAPPPPPLPPPGMEFTPGEAGGSADYTDLEPPGKSDGTLVATAWQDHRGDKNGLIDQAGLASQGQPSRPRPPPPEATWMISSYHPYDGSEIRVMVGDVAVARVVGDALSAHGPLSTAGMSLSSPGAADAAPGSSKQKRGEVESGRATVPSGIESAEKGGLGRLLVLRRGVRVPVLDERGGVTRKVLSIVEVFASSASSKGGETLPSVADTHIEDGAKVAAMTAGNVLLEVIAYPAGLSAAPEMDGRQEGRESLRREGRRRVILTAESLWQRRRWRRSLRPGVALPWDEPPPEGRPTSWLPRPGKHDDDGFPPIEERRNAARQQAEREGEEERWPVPESIQGGEGATASEGEDGDAVREKSAHQQALDDLVDMVAFGPPPEKTDECQGRSSLAMPLVLVPAQSFGPERQREAVVVPGRESAPGCSATSMAVDGLAVALLAEESRAEILLSLVRLGSSGGRGQSSAISVEGIPSTSITPDNAEQSLAETWEEEADRVEPLSMRVSGRRGHSREVPGTCNIGKMGVTFHYPQASERTRAVASFFRDASKSSSDSVMVVVALALDTPKLTPLVIAWEREPSEPEPAPDEDALDVVPRVMIPPGVVLEEGVVSDLGGHIAPDAIVLTKAEKKADFSPPGVLAGDRRGGGGAAVKRSRKAGKEQEWVRHRRDWEEVDEKGFRRYAVYQLLEPDGYMQTLGFGVTKRAALPNTAAVCGRSTFHSEQRCTEQLCRQRTAKDYAYVSANDQHRGPSDPGSYSVSCKHERMAALLRTGLERYNAEMARVAVERERQAKDAALQAKVEIGKARLADRRAREDAATRSLARKTDAQHLKISAGADRSRHKWELRMQDSHIVETRGSWEQRKDLGGSVFYFCKSEEGLPEPFSWDPPECWGELDPSVLALEGAAAAEGESLLGGESSTGPGGSLANEGPLAEQLSSSLRTLGFDPDQPGGGYTNNQGGHDGDETPRQLTEEEQLSLAVTRLAGNEKLLEALAWRLGIPLADVRPDGREPPLARDDQEDEEELDENREQIELGEHDDASDSEGERGDTRESPGPLPQDHADLRRMRVAERRRKAQADRGHGHKQPKHSIVPRLPLTDESQGGRAVGLEGEIGGLGWRRLARADLGQKFLERVVNPRMQGPSPEAINTSPKPRPSSTTDPSNATKRSEDWSVPVEAMFVGDVVAEHARVLHEAERRMKKEELVDDSSSAAFDAAKFAANGPQQEFTTIERRLMALAEDDGRNKEEIEEEENKAKAVIAAKTGNLSELEGLLYENVPPDTKDSNGNTLLLLAAQQGNKRIAKFLLRKGATMNLQNMDGHTVLHFCYSHGHQARKNGSAAADLANYLKAKGADDSLLNSEGLTCYEGLQADRVANI
ncbi:unnamed protein product [Ectocarpus sp. 6 AP-2014]